MGLDFKVWCRKNDEDAVLFSGNGRTAFRFLKKWVGDERYGEDIELSLDDVDTLINEALSYAKFYFDKEGLVYRAMNDVTHDESTFIDDPLAFACRMGNVQMYMKLLGTNAPKYFIECDW